MNRHVLLVAVLIMLCPRVFGEAPQVFSIHPEKGPEEGPGGAKQKLMAMGMQGAYGANVDFLKKGVYTIKVKCVIGDKKLFDRFVYEAK